MTPTDALLPSFVGQAIGREKTTRDYKISEQKRKGQTEKDSV